MICSALRHPKLLFKGVFALALLSGLLFPSRSALAVTSYTDPSGYPAAWPSQLTTQGYTRPGNATQSDLTNGNGDASKKSGSTPSGSNDFSSGSSSNQSSIFFYGNGTVMFFRLRVSSTPLQASSGEPFNNTTTWNILLDTDGDGYKEFVVMLDGTDAGSQPDDIVVIYADSTSQKFNTGSNVLWRQDAAVGSNNGSDGETGSTSTWDTDSNTFVWNFGRTRVVQIDTTVSAGSSASEYFIDIQVPLAAFDTGSSATTLTASKPFTLAATTSTSNTDPTLMDLLFSGTFSLADVKLPTGNLATGNGQITEAPVVLAITNSLVCPNDTILVKVLDAINVSGGAAVTTISSVTVEYYTDVDGDSTIDDNSAWLPVGTATQVSGTLNQWRVVWDASVHANKKYFFRAKATDSQGNTTTSTSQSPSVTGYVSNTCAAVPAFDASTKSFLDVTQPVPATSIIRYVLTIRNNGSGTAFSTVVRDTLDTYLKFYNFVSGQSTGCSVDSTSIPGKYIITCTLGDINSGSTRTRQFRVTVKTPVPDSTTIKNRACITANSPAQPYCAEVDFTISSLPSIDLDKYVNDLADSTSGLPGDTLTFTISYKNTGTDNATTVVVQDANPDFTDYIPNSVKFKGAAKTDAADADEVTVTNAGGGVFNISVTVGTVQPDSSGTVTFKTTIK
jgi:uncharacterized repeat protein (TIGR01451 family)